MKNFAIQITKRGVGELIAKGHPTQNTCSVKRDNNLKNTNRELQMKCN